MCLFGFVFFTELLKLDLKFVSMLEIITFMHTYAPSFTLVKLTGQ